MKRSNLRESQSHLPSLGSSTISWKEPRITIEGSSSLCYHEFQGETAKSPSFALVSRRIGCKATFIAMATNAMTPGFNRKFPFGLAAQSCPTFSEWTACAAKATPREVSWHDFRWRIHRLPVAILHCTGHCWASAGPNTIVGRADSTGHHGGCP